MFPTAMKAGDASGSVIEPPKSDEPTPSRSTPHAPWPLRLSVFTAITAAFLTELASRIVQAGTDVSPAITESMSLMALVLLCGSALYLILRFGDTPLLKWSIVLATTFLLLSQVLNLIEDVPSLRNGGSLAVTAPWLSSAESLLLLAGLILMLATFFFALLETVAIKSALVRERAELYREIAERRQAQASLDDSRNQLRRLSAHLEQVREDERAYLARELHDELGQTLTSLKIDLANLCRFMEKTEQSERCSEIIASMSDQIAATMQVVRRIVTELRPGILDDLGLQAAIEWQLRDFEKRTGISCEPIVEGADIELGREKTTALFRILQETLTNVARHAGATRVEVWLAQVNGAVRLEVADDGCGMPRDPFQEGKSFGILGIRERTTQFGGELRIDSNPGGGTRVIVAIPGG